LKNVIARFKILEYNPIGTPFNRHSKLSITKALNFENGKREMNIIPYANGVGAYGMYDVYQIGYDTCCNCA